jgi:hypothetical protein
VFYVLSSVKLELSLPTVPHVLSKISFLVNTVVKYKILLMRTVTKFHTFVKYILIRYLFKLPIPVAERSKARVCGRSPAGIAGSNLAGGMDVCVVCVAQ